MSRAAKPLGYAHGIRDSHEPNDRLLPLDVCDAMLSTSQVHIDPVRSSLEAKLARHIASDERHSRDLCFFSLKLSTVATRSNSLSFFLANAPSFGADEVSHEPSCELNVVASKLSLPSASWSLSLKQFQSRYASP